MNSGSSAAFNQARELPDNDTDDQLSRILPNVGDDKALCGIIERLAILRLDTDRHGQLLAFLCLPQNRDAIRNGPPEALDSLFRAIDIYRSQHVARMQSINGE